MNKFVTNKSNLPQSWHNCFLIWGDWLSCDPCEGYHVTHVRVNWAPSSGNFVFSVTQLFILYMG